MRLVVVQAEDACDKSVRDAIISKSIASSSGLLLFSRNASMIFELPVLTQGAASADEWVAGGNLD
jgi:hypothetical protein